LATNIDVIGITPKSDFDLTRLVEKGLPTEKLSLLAQQGLTATEISQIVIPARTLKHRKARREALSHEETDRFIRLARLLTLADQVFGEHRKAMLWFRTPDDRVNNRTPLSLLTSDAGGRLVESLLWQIDEGVYA
jgi:putative toxin-antitoxin system antitoxin component (TIGR02293 family)